MPLPSPCPVPELCGRPWPWRWHVSPSGRATCLSHQQEKTADLKERQKRSIVKAEQRRRESWSQRQNDSQAKARAEATDAHRPEKPILPEDAALIRNGERQLTALEFDQLEVVGLLMSSDVYSINKRMRNKGSLTGGAGARIDYDGYGSMQEFVDRACGVFDHLGDELDLDEEIRLFRGFGVPRTPDKEHPDIAGLREHLDTGTGLHEEFTDAGFSFATTDPQDALAYKGNAQSDYPHRDAIMIELVARRGLCSPEKRHRSTALFEHVFEAGLLSKSIGQVIFPPGTRWEITSFNMTSRFGVTPATPQGIPLVIMKQVD
jgi:hypothetical protein